MKIKFSEFVPRKGRPHVRDARVCADGEDVGRIAEVWSSISTAPWPEYHETMSMASSYIAHIDNDVIRGRLMVTVDDNPYRPGPDTPEEAKSRIALQIRALLERGA